MHRTRVELRPRIAVAPAKRQAENVAIEGHRGVHVRRPVVDVVEPLDHAYVGGVPAEPCPRIRAFCASNSCWVSTPRSRRSASRWSSLVTVGAWRSLEAPAPHALLVLLALVVDRLLDVLGVANVAELLSPGLARGMDHERAGADHPLPDLLFEAHVVDVLERDLHRSFRDQPVPMDHSIAGDREVVGEPVHDASDGVDDDHDRSRGHQSPPEPRPGAALGHPRQRDDPGDRDQQDHHTGTDEFDPMRAQIQDEFLVVDQQASREGHGRTLPRLRGPGKRRSALVVVHVAGRRCSISPNATVTVSPPVSTSSPPRASRSSASPSTRSPAVVVARTRRPSVTHHGR